MKNHTHHCRVQTGFILILLFCLVVVPQHSRSESVAIEAADVAFDIEFSPDGQTLAIARATIEPIRQFGRIELWDTETGLLRRVIQGFDGPVRSITFTPDGKTLISGSLEYLPEKLQQKATSRSGQVSAQVKWWDVSTGDLRQKSKLPGEYAISIRVECSPDGKQLAAVQTLRHASSFIGSPGDPLSFSPFIISELRLLDSGSGQQKVKVNINSPGALTYSSDGKFIATVSDSRVKILDAKTGKRVGEAKDFRGWPNALAFSPDSQSLAVVSTKYDRGSAGNLNRMLGHSEVKIFDVKDWSLSAKLNDLGAVRCLTYEPTGRFLFIGGMLNDNEKAAVPSIKLWDLKSRAIVRYPTGGDTYDQAVRLITVAQNGRLLAFASGDESIKIIDTHGWKVRQTMDASSVGDKVKKIGRALRDECEDHSRSCV